MLKHIPFYASLLGRQMKSGKKSNNGMVLVYGAIEVHAMGEKGCIASNGRIAQETGLSAGTVANYISELNKSGWIKVNTKTVNGGIVRVNIEPLLTIKTPSSTSDTLHTSVIPPSSGDDTPLHLGVNIDNNIDNNKKTTTNTDTLLKELLNKVTGRNFRVLPNGYKKTLKEFTLEEIEKALLAMKKDKWHSERWGSLKSDYLIRSSTIDNFLNKKSSGYNQSVSAEDLYGDGSWMK